jgi:hypothetical protein
MKELIDMNAIFNRQHEILQDPPLVQKLLAHPKAQQAMIEDFQSVELAGEMGDPTGVKAYDRISAKPLEKWRGALQNPLRKSWCRSYLKWLGAERLANIGYDQQELLRELDSVPSSMRRIGGDLTRMSYGFFYQFFELRLMQDKIKQLPHLKDIHPHL